MKMTLLAMTLVLAAPVYGNVDATPATKLEISARGLIAKRLMAELGEANAMRSIRGTKALWTEISLQKPANMPAMENLAADMKQTDLDGQLRTAGFKLMDPKKRSLALGLRPTLVITVLFVPKGSEGNDVDYYLVTARATQDVTPLGGERMSMTTWLRVREPVVASGDASLDVNAIRSAVKAAVLGFIDVAQDNNGSAPAAGSRP